MILSNSLVELAINEILSAGADFAEVFVESTDTLNLTLSDSTPKGMTSGRLRGAGLRAMVGDEVFYATTTDLTEAGLRKAARALKDVISSSKKQSSIHLGGVSDQGTRSMSTVPLEKKWSWLNTLDREARSRSSLVNQVEGYYLEKTQTVQIANSLGTHVVDIRPYSGIALEVYAEDQGKKESSGERERFLLNPEWIESLDLKEMSHSAVDRATALCRSGYAPAGEFPVIIDNGFGGVIFHEACGHGLETTSVAKKASVFADKLGEQVASKVVTAIDDGTIAEQWGSLKYDDEGQLTQKTVLIENGILKSYIADKKGSQQTGYKTTGSGRRESFLFAPASRMRNTYIAAGNDNFEDMVKSVDFGIYAKKMGGGSVSPATGDYNFRVEEAYVIRKGRIEEMVKGASLIGRGIDTLGKISMVSKDLKLEPGMCGSVSGWVPTTVGQPQILVSSLIVGGRA